MALRQLLYSVILSGICVREQMYSATFMWRRVQQAWVTSCGYGLGKRPPARNISPALARSADDTKLTRSARSTSQIDGLCKLYLSGALHLRGDDGQASQSPLSRTQCRVWGRYMFNPMTAAASSFYIVVRAPWFGIPSS